MNANATVRGSFDDRSVRQPDRWAGARAAHPTSLRPTVQEHAPRWWISCKRGRLPAPRPIAERQRRLPFADRHDGNTSEHGNWPHGDVSAEDVERLIELGILTPRPRRTSRSRRATCFASVWWWLAEAPAWPRAHLHSYGQGRCAVLRGHRVFGRPRTDRRDVRRPSASATASRPISGFACSNRRDWPPPRPGPPATDDDVAIVAVIALALRSGLQEESGRQVARVYGESLRRIAEMNVPLYSRIRRDAPPGGRAGGGSDARDRAPDQPGDPICRGAHDPGDVPPPQEHQITQHMIEHIEAELEEAVSSNGERPHLRRCASLTSRATAAHGWSSATGPRRRWPRTWPRLAQATSALHGGKPVKWLGTA